MKIAVFLSDSAQLRTLHFPKSVDRFYRFHGYENAWTNADLKKNWLKTSVVLLESAQNYGFTTSDYHLPYLSEASLNFETSFISNLDSFEYVSADIYLTDALITFLNHLHFGKFNPFYSPAELDDHTPDGFRAEEVLKNVQNLRDLHTAILNAQPNMQAYTDLRDYLNAPMLAGNDPPFSKKKILINMERLRWFDPEKETYIFVNIPSYTLALHRKGDIAMYKVIVGKPGTPSPVLKSAVVYFSTAPDWVVPPTIFKKEMLPKILRNRNYLAAHHYSLYHLSGKKIPVHSGTLAALRRNPNQYVVRQAPGASNALGAVVFRFPNSYSVYLHDTSDPKLFSLENRALSHGCIRVEDAKKLAEVLLTYDGAEEDIPELKEALKLYTKKDFVLRQPVPIVIAYLTCLIEQGKPVVYPDIYHLDPLLEEQFQ